MVRERSPESWRVLTVPNAISFARLLGVPVFLWLMLGPVHYDLAAVVVLAVGGGTDWVDGYVARRFDQGSRLGQLLDPLADRLYILATLAALTIREIVPWQFTAALLAREVVVGVWLPVLRRYGYGPPPVHYIGKTGTFVLLMAFPTLLLSAATSGTVHTWAYAAGWALGIWGLALYWLSGVLYLWQIFSLIREARQESRV
ncbi:CDP-alcohol phosphatidyltransferase family protein [Longispora albida]|uniref:CDP-alcohol phosphatidyltransferase family protein n=1 Tax=Longispora albida TaxID=203523 RepID=UPI00036C85B1|nr:CDP-alcohol phosphatidyltransferase family protein [Longispora albida]